MPHRAAPRHEPPETGLPSRTTYCYRTSYLIVRRTRTVPRTARHQGHGGNHDMNDTPAIRAEGLTKNFGTTRALAGLDLTVPAGTVYGLLGPNGAGKTTAVRVF